MARLGLLFVVLGIGLLWLASQSFARSTFVGVVISVADGDSVTVLRDRFPVKIRLSDIDAPEHGQAFGEQSKQALSHLVYRKAVTVDPREIDRYGRTVARVFVGPLDVNLAMVDAGYAWWYRQYSHDGAVAKAERGARMAGRGLWVDPHPQPPWNFRHQ